MGLIIVNDDTVEELKEKKEKEKEKVEKKEELKKSKGEQPAENSENKAKEKKELEEKLEKAEREIAELKETILRKQADYENFRKRMVREKEETVKFANTNLLVDLISIIDDFERAINSSEDSKDFDTFHKGIELIEKQFTSMLEKKWNLVRFEPAGEKFDPEKHEAFMVEEKSGIDEPVVAEVFQNGYLLNNRVVRNAKVKVFMPLKEANGSESEEKGEERNEAGGKGGN
jgi:molecular chaperone GrpE